MKNLRFIFALWAALLVVLAAPVALAQPAPGLSQSQAERLLSPRKALRAVVSLPFRHSTGVTATSGGSPDLTDVTWFNVYTLTEATDHLVLTYSNFHTDTSAGETTGTKYDVTTKVWIRSGTVLNTWWGPIPVTFRNGAATTATVHPRTFVRSDPVFIGLLPAGAQIRLAERTQMANGGNLPVGRLSTWGCQGFMAGDQTENSAPTLTSYSGFSAALIQAYGRDASGLALMGDSIVQGTGDTGGVNGGGFARRCSDLSIGTVYAPKSGESGADWLSAQSKRQNRLALSAMMPYAVWEYIVNDLQAGTTFETAKANAITAVREMGSLGTRVFLTTCVPKTSSSDSWATATNQTPSLPGSGETYRVQWNTWLRSGQAARDIGSSYAGFFDVAAQIEVDANNVLTLNGGRWKAGTTGDGLHPNQSGHTLVGNAITSAHAALIKGSQPGFFRGFTGALAYNPRAELEATLEAARNNYAFAI